MADDLASLLTAQVPPQGGLSELLRQRWAMGNGNPVTPESRDGRVVQGQISNRAERPADWAVKSGVAETLSPTMQGYGAGQMASYARDALGSGDYGTATGAGLMAAMSMLPMYGKGKLRPASPELPREIPALAGEQRAAQNSLLGATSEVNDGLRVFHGSPNEFKAFSEDGPHWFSTDEQTATAFGKDRMGVPMHSLKKPHMYDATIGGKVFDVDPWAAANEAAQNSHLPKPETWQDVADILQYGEWQKSVLQDAQDAGHSAVRFKNVGDSPNGRISDHVAVLEPSSIKLNSINGNALMPPEPTGIRAYHGSPHDFDKFDISKIGTGEGAQAYGHGLYFAENEGVAKSYRETLSKLDTSNPEVRAAQALEQSAGNRDDAIARLRGNAEYRKQNEQRSGIKQDWEAEHSAAELLASGTTPDPSKTRPGRMYEVNIKADPEHFLDWDKPVYQQSEHVKNALKSIGANTEPRGQYQVTPSAKGDKWTVRNQYGESVGTFASKEAAEAKAQTRTDAFNNGSTQLEYMKLGGNAIYSNLDKGEASAKLRDAGVKGIRYLDQGSRTAGEGSRNYVVFDPATIEILRKYGLVPPVAATTLPGFLQGQQSDQ